MIMTISECLENRLSSLAGVSTGTLQKVEKGAIPWFDQKYEIKEFSSFLKNGYFIQQSYGNISIGSVISVSVNGPSTIYVFIHGGMWDGGYSASLPKDLWSTENGHVTTSGNQQLYRVFYRVSYKASDLVLPPSTTDSTVMLIIVVPYCSGM